MVIHSIEYAREMLSLFVQYSFKSETKLRRENFIAISGRDGADFIREDNSTLEKIEPAVEFHMLRREEFPSHSD